jgi:hypothetical protein
LGDDGDNILVGGNNADWFEGRGGDNMLIGGGGMEYADYLNTDTPSPSTFPPARFITAAMSTR